ncbi:hypothetical protein MCUN1_000578 [Malassezia cuniculi]|uniref:Midasin n=1 Tax=Malassezia cuniculi TaxID=948313 RepID=A0AAF0ESU2_9BASI|nr:hypothetical protein MCUN1_000578 [Malassezia cuniculi]
MDAVVAVDLRACAAALLPHVPPNAHANVLHIAADGHHCSAAAVLDAAAALLISHTEPVAAAFRGVLVDLVLRAGARYTQHEVLYAYARLVGAFEEAFEPIHDYIKQHYPHGVFDASEERLLAQYRLLRAAPSLAEGWSSAPLHALFSSGASPTARFLAIECFAMQEGLAESARSELVQKWIGDADAPIGECDAHLLSIYEDKRISALWSQEASRVSDAPLFPTFDELVTGTRVVGGVILYSHGGDLTDDSFVATSGASEALRQVALRHALRLPVLISGPPACGKTHLLEHLASNLRNRGGAPQVLSIQLGDQSGVDAKQLVGSFVSSTTKPGTFEWVEGALTRAVVSGMWVVLEDIDRASGDVLSVIAPLVEALGPTKRVGARPTLDLGARGSVTAGPGFALFATRTATSSARPRFLSANHWAEVHLPPPTRADLCEILSRRFPPLFALPRDELSSIVDAWNRVAELSSPSGTSHVSNRRITLRELIRWGARISRQPNLRSIFANPVVQEEVFLDGCDLFIASLPSEMHNMANQCANVLAAALHMDSDRASWALRERVPELAARESLHTGRVVLHRTPDAPSSLSRYALTKGTLAVIERVAAGVAGAEPLLLVGETGTGKTTLVQNLATLLGKQITVLNMSQQTESSDLLGAYKPVDPVRPASALHNTWTLLFERSFSLKRNAPFLDAERRALVKARWSRLVRLWEESARMAQTAREAIAAKGADPNIARKRRRTDEAYPTAAEWDEFITKVREFAALYTGKRNFVFSYVEGPLVHALRHGHWLLLDELNLAAPEALECLAPLLQSPTGSVVLAERGDVTPIPRHPEFRLFGCMNPATDVGKRDLPPPLRSRFTEVYVPSPDSDIEALVSIVAKYIGEATVGDQSVVLDVAEWYASVRSLAAKHELADGVNQRPHYSVRTLARALTFALAIAPDYGIRRALSEGLFMSFGTLLDTLGQARLKALISQHILSKSRDKRRAAPSFVPPAREGHVAVGPFWLRTGPLPPQPVDDYVCTPSVQAKLEALARPLVTRQSPVLIQGPTSAGKTSAVEYLARRTGHRFVRINNHEHTDVQEYLGSYASDASGQLVFSEGLLVTALRRGDWIVLDELNLAPTDVLEALNRLLDDNRELMIPETGEVIRPHPDFMLFATQNPPGAYAGRKMLSRAFRNRFVELHFGDVPQDELATILTRRCSVAPSYAERIVNVFVELQRRRETERVFDRHAFATLRDLFRWGARPVVGVQQLAETGYMLIAERARQASDRETVRRVLEDVMNVKINADSLYSLDEGTTAVAQLGKQLAERLVEAAGACNIVWTSAMRRLVVLSALSMMYKEPILLVGETGAGKTSVCDLLADAFGRALHSFNCHQNTDSADLLGGQRPLRDRATRKAQAEAEACEALDEADVDIPDDGDYMSALEGLNTPRAANARRMLSAASALFEWCDGPLVQAMRDGDAILLDEVSLADDSVLERLNSVLEPGRTLVLAEKAGAENLEITAADGFAVIATMNPGGDYGKKELSPALRNRFTEIWVPPVDLHRDRVAILAARLSPDLRSWIEPMLEFARWLDSQVGDGLGVRDLLAWAAFVEGTAEYLGGAHAFAHGAALVAIDGLGATAATAAIPPAALSQLRTRAYHKVNTLIAPAEFDPSDPKLFEISHMPDSLHVGPFSLPALGRCSSTYALNAHTTASNALRVLRAMAVGGRSVLLEGSPGAGKTSLVTALAALTGNSLTRINLSDQTELVDLFGAELPVPGGRAGEFEWRPAAFLRAMQRGEWVLLDEMNLASQTVLEGLNSCLDHRGSVYVAEIGRTFAKHPDFRLFAAQNPHHQGGARKGLPRSLLNRFSKVWVTELTDEDALAIGASLYPSLPREALAAMVHFNGELQRAAAAPDTFAQAGAPWEFNLRDVLRWLALVHSQAGASAVGDALEHVVGLYLLRFRSAADREKAAALAEQCLGRKIDPVAQWAMHAGAALIGHSVLGRGQICPQRCTALLPNQLALLSAMADSVRMGWLTIVCGPGGSGKTSMVRLLADIAGVPLEELRLSSASDTMDVLGSFEQRDPAVTRAAVLREAEEAADAAVRAAAHGQSDISALVQARANLHGDAASEALAFLEGHVDGAHAAALRAAREHIASTQDASAGTFEWVDGPLVRAARRGAWLLLDDANLCSASVLDRLNSLFESPPSLALSERGMVNGEVPQLEPHPAFRVFMVLDPRHGELSRAMRNRGMELFIDAKADPPIRGPDSQGTPIERAVAAHAARRGMDIARGVSSSCDLRDASLSNARFILGEQQSEELFVYAAQTLSQSEMQLILRAMPGAAAVFGAAATAAAPLVAARNAHLASIGIHVAPMLGADSRRLPLSRFDDNAAKVAATVEAAVRGTIRLAELDALPETSIIQRSARCDPELARELSMMHAIVHGTAALVKRADESALAVLRDIDAATALLVSTMGDSAPDYSLLRVLLQTLRDALLNVPGAEQLLSAVHSALAPLSADGGILQHALWAHSLPHADARDMELLGELERTLSVPVDPKVHATGVQLLATLHLGAYGEHRESLRDTVAEFIRRAATTTHVAPQFLHIGRALPLVLLSMAAFPPTPPAARAVLELDSVHAQHAPGHAVALQLAAWGATAAAPLALRPLKAAGSRAVEAGLLHTVLEASSDKQVPLRAWKEYEVHRDGLARVIAAAPLQQRSEALKVLLDEALGLLAVALADTVRSAVPSGELLALPDSSLNARDAARSAAQMLHATNDQLAAALVEWAACADAADESVGKAYVRTGLYAIHVYLPAVPLDPVAEARANAQYAESLCQRARALAAVETAAVSARAQQPNAVISALEEAARAAEETAARVAQSRVARATDPALLARLHRELHAFFTQVLDPSRIERLVSRIADGSGADEAATLAASLTAIESRLERNFAPLRDLCTPYLLALSLVATGLALLVPSTAHVKTLGSATRFPSVAAAQALREKKASRTCAVAELLAALSGAVYDASSGIAITADDVSPVYDQLYVLWAAERERNRAAAEEKASLYIHKALEETDEQAALEAEMRRLFPTYDDVLEESETRKDAPIRLDEAALETVALAHMTLFARRDYAQALPSFATATERLANMLSSHCNTPGSAHLDTSSSAFQIRILAPRPAPARANFYHDAQPQETGRVAPILTQMISRIEASLAELPEQQQLLQLSERCNKVASLPTYSPIAKVLTAIEQLLVLVDDWETFASRETSLRSFANELTALIVEWRRLELSGWAHLLDEEVKNEERIATQWFFSLYEALVRGAGDRIGELVELLDSFIRQSTAGQFAVRLALVHAYAEYAMSIDRRVAEMLHSIAAFYSQFAARISATLDKQRGLLEREIREFVKLASWRDVNVYSLRMSAQKTHTYLLRTMRKFRDVLRQPVEPILAAAGEERPTVVVRTLQGAAGASLPHEWCIGEMPAAKPRNTDKAHLADAEKTAARLRSVSSKLSKSLQSSAGEALSELGDEILSVADDLAQKTPAMLDDDNEKAVKALATQKRRAWAELLRELRRLGLTSGVSADLLARNRDAAAVYAIAAPRASIAADALATEAADAYHVALLAQLPRVRAATSSPQGDVPVAELQRALAYIEHATGHVYALRKRAAHFMDGARRVWELGQRVRTLASADRVYSLSGVQTKAVGTAAALAARVGAALDEFETLVPQYARVSPLECHVPLDDIRALRQRADSLQKQIRSVAVSLDTGITACTASEFDTARQCIALVDDVDAVLGRCGAGVAAPASLFRSWLSGVRAKAGLDVLAAPLESGGATDTDALCSSVLVIAQELSGVGAIDEALADRAIPEQMTRLATVERILRPHEIGDAICAAMSNDALESARQIAPFLAPYTELLFAHARTISLVYRALARLVIVLCVIVTNLATKGFCTPPPAEEEEAGEGAEGGEQLEGGTGLGDGQGAKDISDTIQDDEYMDELNTGDDGGETEQEKNARESEQVDGDAQSVGSDGEQEAGDDGEDEEEEDVDDEIGGVDPLDPDAVDEKMWDNDQMDDTQGESEAQGGVDDKKESAGERNEGDGEGEGDKDDQFDEPQPNVEELPDQGLGRDVDDEARDEMQLDDVELSDDGEANEMQESDDEDFTDAPEAQDKHGNDIEADDKDMQEQDEEPQGEQVADGDAESNSDEMDADDQQVDDDTQQLEADDQPLEADEQPLEADEKLGSDDEQPQDADDADNDATGEEQAGPEVPEAPEETPQTMPSEAPGRPEANPNSSLQDADDADDAVGDNAGAAGGQQETAGAQGDAAHASAAAEASKQDADNAEANADADADMGGGGGGAATEANKSDNGNHGTDERVNPIHSLSESLEHFRRDVDAIGDATQNPGDSGDAADMDSGDVEHVAQDEHADGEAAGAADEQQAQQTRGLYDLGDGEAPPAMEDAEEEAMEEEKADPLDFERGDTAGASIAPGERAMGAADVRAERMLMDEDEERVREAQEEIEPLSMEERAARDESVAQELEEMRSSEGSLARASELWRSYVSLTADLAFGLCEQLRLILVPTLATRLNGDYRTGKRLNMRKIIPFIASDFAKDKIWLRRTKPSAREYQVLLAIDDSKSMAEGRNIHLAYQTLALVSGALSRLEVGDIGICRFGHGVDMLHDFGHTSFSEAHGGEILSRLRFDQTGTNMPLLIDRSLEVLQEARNKRTSASSSDLWQLEIIISDGVCQDHDRLRALLRRAAEERVMIVFVVVDAEPGESSNGSSTSSAARSSILTMNQVNYHTDAAGKLQLDMKRYIDTFPFEHYVIVRDVHALPAVLATTLRQWAERIRDA